MAFKFRLTPEAEALRAQIRDLEAATRSRFANMTDENLVASTRFYMQNAEPKRWAPVEPVYDATLWHVILPELLRRLDERANPQSAGCSACGQAEGHAFGCPEARG